jgi:hypothetical protein
MGIEASRGRLDVVVVAGKENGDGRLGGGR